MNKGNSKYLIALISFALIGSILVQLYLFSSAIDVRKARFDSEVLTAMRDVGARLEALEAVRVIEGERAFRPWLQSQIPNVFEVDSQAQHTPSLNPHNLDHSEIQFLDSTGFYTFSYRADTTYYSPAGPFRVEVSKEGSGTRMEDGKIQLHAAQMRKVEEKVLMMDTVLQMFVRSSVRDFAPIDTRFTNSDIDSIIQLEMAEKGIAMSYEFAITEGDLMTSLESVGFDPLKDAYKVAILKHDLWDSPRYLLIQLPNRNVFIYESMWVMFSLGILFTLGLILTFWMTIRQMLKQKKINTIKSDFINNMTHEFKTPLATINLAIDALNSPKLVNDPERRKHYTQIIRKENQRMHKQVEHVLQMSLLDRDEVSLNMQTVRIGDIIEDAVNHLELTIRERGGDITTIDGGLLDAEVSVDIHHFTNVLINILDNAVKYSMEPPQIRVALNQTSSQLQIAISDKGIGMNREAKEHIFDRFYRAEAGNLHTVKGHGLGLAYAKEIVERLGGKIEVQSQLGEGSTFVITLGLS